jgi:DNA-binding CsgD family transcriptional regulator
MIGLLLVEALLATNRRDEAMLLLVTLIELAAQSGLHQTLVDCSEPVCGLFEVIVRGESELVEDQRELLPYLGALMMRRRAEIELRTVRAASVRLGKLTPPMGLSEREHTIVRLMGSGLTNKQIAAHLRIAPETVKSHAKHLYEKLSVKNRTEAVTLASRYGLV